MRKRKPDNLAHFCLGLVLGLGLIGWASDSWAAGTWYLSPSGSDSHGDGSRERPWKTIGYASGKIPDDGSTIVLLDGLYEQPQSVGRQFNRPCVIRAENPCRARLRSPAGGNRVLTCYGAANVTFRGLEMFGSGSARGEYLVHVGTANSHHVLFEDCLIHDCYNNDLVKVNDFAHHITFRGCVFYNQTDHEGDQHLDINTVTDIAIEDSILFNNYAGSGRRSGNRSQGFVVVKNSGSTPNVTRRIAFRRNIFLGWDGKPDQAFLLLGEDGKPFFEAQELVIENNLFVHNSPVRSWGTLLLKGGLRDVTFRANTVVGHPVAKWSGAFAAVCLRIEHNPPMGDLTFANNIWCDAMGGMPRFTMSDAQVFAPGSKQAMLNNIYWNGGKRIPTEAKDTLVPDRDPSKHVLDPRLGNPGEGLTPHWDGKGQFRSGQKTIRGEFERLVRLCAVPGEGSPATGAADSSSMPADDILGNPRGNRPDIGCFQKRAAPPKLRVDREHHRFADAGGKPFLPFGVNYYRPGTGWAPQLWKQFDAEATRRDFARLKRQGANVVRVFISFGSFFTEPGKLNPEGLAKFDQFLDLADEAGLYVHPTGPDAWEGMPAWTKDLNVFSNDTNQPCIKALEDYWRWFAARYRGRSTIWAYDLRNEPHLAWDTPHLRMQWAAWRKAYDQDPAPVPDPKRNPPEPALADYQRFRESIAEKWVARQSAAIHAADPEALVTVGLIQWSVPAQRIMIDQYAGFRPTVIAKHLDFMELHYYPLVAGAYDYAGPAAETANLAVLEAMARECAKPGLPLVIAEFGWYGGGPLTSKGKPASEEEQSQWCRHVVDVTAPMACGWLNWGMYDHPQAKDVSKLTGLFTVDGKEKAWGRAFRDAAQRLRANPPAYAIPNRPDLPWAACTASGDEMEKFRRAYLAVFAAGWKAQ